MEFLEAKAIAERLGFQLFADVRGDTNALRLFTEDFRQKFGKKSRCGVYMQFRADGSCYIGQSLDVDRRHKRHANSASSSTIWPSAAGRPAS